MIAQIRAFAKSWFATLLIGVLIVSFGVWGVRDVFRGHLSNDVIQAGPRHIGPGEFKRDFDNYRKQLEQQAGQPITPEIAVQNHLDVRVAEEIANREAFAALIEKMGIRPSDQQLQAQIAKMPAFINHLGQFDKSQYRQVLAQNYLTPLAFESRMRDEMAQQQVGAGLVNGLRAPRAYAALGAVFATEARDIGYFTLEPKAVPAVAPPTDADLNKFMQENAQALMKPEFRILTVVRFSPALVAGNVAVDEAELKKRFDFKKDTLSKPDTRSLVQIPVKDAATAQAVSARLAKGEDAAAIAKSVGAEAITYDDKPKSAIADPKVADQAFSIASGAVATVQGGLGLAVIKVTKITPGHAVTFAEARPQLEAEMKKQLAGEKVYELSQKYDEAHSGGASLPEAAQKAGVPAITVGPVSQQGADPQGKPVESVNPKLLQTAFGLPAGGESEVQEAGGGEYYAVRVEKIIPKAMRTLDEVRPLITKAWVQRETGKRLAAKAEELVARVKKGESLDTVAASVGQHAVHVNGVTRQGAAQVMQTNKALSQEALGNAFAVKSGEVFVASSGDGFAALVGKLEAIHAPAGADIAKMVEQARPQMTVAIFREMSADARRAARAEEKVKIYPEMARQALGVETPADKAKTKGLAQ